MAAGVLVIAAALIAAQLIPTDRSNPPVRGDISAPPEIEATLRRACYDCHSDQTHWPWYSRVAPISWLIDRDVALGRKEVNFSEWGTYYPVTRRRKLEWIGRALREENMPPWNYRLTHPGARLTASDKIALEGWIEGAISAPAPSGSSEQGNEVK